MRLLDEDRWQTQLLSLKAIFRFPGVVQRWATADFTIASPTFVALVEEILAEEPDRADA